MEINKIYNGTCLEIIKTFPDKSINCVITSPPYWQLRDYGWTGQWGLEPTYQMYLENLWSLMDEIWRVLKDDGTCWINLGDTYNGNKEGNTSNKGYKEFTEVKTFKKAKQQAPDKCLLLIPHRFAIGCIDRGWIMRNDIIWAKRNGMPESVTDRFSKKHEYFFFMTKSTKYYFDLDGIRDKHATTSLERFKYNFTGQEGGKSNNMKGRKYTKYTEGGRLNWTGEKSTEGHELGKNPGSVADFWDIPTKPSTKEHYATFNASLIDKPIIAGCPEEGIVLDPFAGTATTLVRAYQLNRKVIGIEGSKDYHDIAFSSLEKELRQLKLF